MTNIIYKTLHRKLKTEQHEFTKQFVLYVCVFLAMLTPFVDFLQLIKMFYLSKYRMSSNNLLVKLAVDNNVVSTDLG